MLKIFKQARVLLFFIAVVLLSTIYPFFLGNTVGLVSLYGLISIVLVTGIYAVRANRRWTVLSAALGLITLLSMWMTVAFPDIFLLRAIWTLAQIGFFGWVTLGLFARILSSKRITRDTLLASATVYFLLAITWAALFQLLELLQPDSFQIAGQPEAVVSTDVLIYFAQVTLSSVGYGEITPVTPLARSLAALLAMTGQLYLAVLVAILIGIYLSNGKQLDK